MNHYKVQLQHGISGEIEEYDYYVRWDPEKVNHEEVARACAAEATVKGGRHKDGWKHPYAPLTAILMKEENHAVQA